MNDLNKMGNFLCDIDSLIKSNPDEIINSDIIYSYLINYETNLSTNYDVRQMYFNEWLDKNIYKSNVKVFVSKDFPSWFQFVNMRNNKHKEEIKLYIPLDIFHIKDGVQMLIDYIDENDIECHCKVAKKIRNDNVVIRVQKIEDAKKIINYVNNTKYLRKGLLKTNPFLVNYNGVGVAMDGNYSYNTTVCEAIFDFFNSNTVDKSLKSFNSFVIEKSKTVSDPMLRNIYNQIGNVTCNKGDFSSIEKNYYQIMHGNYDMNEENDLDKKSILLNSSIQNLIKYGPEQLLFALKDNDPKYGRFTRTGNARDSMIKNIKVYEIPNIIIEYFKDNKVKLSKNLPNEQLYDHYVDSLMELVDFKNKH